ncbi:hypothetical protein Tco_1143940 [Tanacetum coccineum]
MSQQPNDPVFSSLIGMSQLSSSSNTSTPSSQNSILFSQQTFFLQKRALINAEAEAIQMILNGVGNSIYSTMDACLNSKEMWLAVECLQQGDIELGIQYHNNEPSSSKLVLEVVSLVDLIDTSSLQELELLFSPMHDEYFSDENQVNVNDEENNNDQAVHAQFDEDEYINPFVTPVTEVTESSSRDTRQQLATDLEMCMYALTVSTADPNNIKEAIDDHVWIEAMPEELH